MQNVNEYIDIENIIKRLQDVDKLKMVLLDENQRKVFELLPKPGFGGDGKQLNSSVHTLESITFERKHKRFPKHSLRFLPPNNPINGRIIQMLEPEVKIQIEKINPGFVLFELLEQLFIFCLENDQFINKVARSDRIILTETPVHNEISSNLSENNYILFCLQRTINSLIKYLEVTKF